ncbi:MAG: CgeB family protein [Pseudomonas sp.]
MNILVIGKFYTEGFALHIAETLDSMGHALRRFEPGFASNRIGGWVGQRIDQVRGVFHSTTDSLPVVRARRMRALWHVADAGPLDVVIVCHDFLWPAEVAELKRRTGAMVAMWFPDHLGTVGRGLFMNAPYDRLFFKDPYIVQVLGDVLASPVHYLPECFNPGKHWLSEEAIGQELAYRCDVATAGNSHAYRVSFFKHLASYDVKQWGNHPPLWLPTGPVAKMHQGRQVLNHDKVRAFRGAKIVVNNLHFGEVWGVNVRAFEAAGAGAFQLVDWRPGLGQLFEDGREIVAFRSMKDLKALIDHWLPREDERRVIAEAGMQRAHAEHTYRHRLDLLLATLGGCDKGFPMPVIKYQVRNAG